MADTIQIKMNVKLIDKSRLYEGKKGLYLNAVLIPTPNNQYGDDFMIVEASTKEERDAGHKGKILGNAKFAKGAPAVAEADVGDGDNDIAF